ncbi:atrial natriuretic peptide receptor 1-like [Paramacrobiotus metropolitanus]|uniref:atrial natriuretic peptide receptor 1-like n=1 Tax=Paramacrobiotus metropolitanus TaxID=2943436 RepID=UPI002445EDE4|nr:atrial natriuretic peptide receptor 1-like [Paramacrobiotus metropolitanus]
MQEILTKSKPYFLTHWDEFTTTAKSIVIDVKRGLIPPKRPKLTKSNNSSTLYEQMEKCWEEEPSSRPTFQKVNEMLAKLGKRSGRNIVDHLIRKMEQYTQQLEEEVHNKMQQLIAEKERSDNLLKHMLPKSVAASLTRGESVPPETFQSVTIMFSDIPGFNDLVSKITAFEVLDTLNALNQWADLIMEHFDVYKVESIMDIYMVASGLPVRNGNHHAAEMSKLSIRMRKDIHKLRTPGDPSKHLQIRFGIHSGSCVAGIVGLKMPRYCLFGDAVNTASRMQSSSEAMKIQITDSTKNILEETGGFVIEERGIINVKGKGEMTTYWLKGALLADT